MLIDGKEKHKDVMSTLDLRDKLSTYEKLNNIREGIPWWSSGYDSTLPLQGALVGSLGGELRSRMPRRAAERKKKNNNTREIPS